MRRKLASNWELSVARAIAAVRFPQEKGGVDPRHLDALGYGEFHRLAPNPTMEGRAHILSRWGENSPKIFRALNPGTDLLPKDSWLGVRDKLGTLSIFL